MAARRPGIVMASAYIERARKRLVKARNRADFTRQAALLDDAIAHLERAEQSILEANGYVEREVQQQTLAARAVEIQKETDRIAARDRSRREERDRGTKRCGCCGPCLAHPQRPCVDWVKEACAKLQKELESPAMRKAIEEVI